MTEVKVGEWYADGSLRLFCAGIKSCGTALMESRIGIIENYDKSTFDMLEHLPDCNGWSWVPKVYPEYWTSVSEGFAFVRVDSKNRCTLFHKDGTVDSSMFWDNNMEKDRTRLTEEEALAMLKPECSVNKPTSTDNDWVQIKNPNHVIRDTDEASSKGNFRERLDFSNFLQSDASGFISCVEMKMTGKQIRDQSWAIFRCRRSDLPKRTITVPKWLVSDFHGLTFIVEQSVAPQGHDEVYQVGETTYEVEG